MSEILSIEGAKVKIGEEGGKVTTVPIASLNYAGPKVGDKVDVYKDGENYIVKRSGNASGAIAGTTADGGKTVNKHVFVWVGNFLFGGFGVDRFMRGQTGLGVFKLLLTLLGWIPFGLGSIAVWVWVLVDWIISMTKAYGQAYASEDNLTFDAAGNYTK